MDLKAIYLTSLAQCAPDVLVKRHVDASMPRNVVAIGKCAGALLDGVAGVIEIENAFVAIPAGYPLPSSPAEIHIGGHPEMTQASFAAGSALIEFVDRHDDILFLVSGGGSACVEVARAPHSEREVAALNAQLIASGLPIHEINRRRSEVSAIKAGRLRERVRGRSVTLVYSDVSTGALADVASGPTLRDRGDAILIADNTTLTAAAAQTIGDRAIRWEHQIEVDVLEAARLLARGARELKPGEILVAGGEPTVKVRGTGSGGRCSELAVRFALESPFRALFGSSDGVDGNSGAAGFYLPPRTAPGAPDGFGEALDRSDSYSIATQLGEPIIIAATGSNLRDLFLVARD